MIQREGSLREIKTKALGVNQNYIFENDPRRCYKEFRGAQSEVDDPPYKEDAENFWKPIYERSKSHNTTFQWIKDHENYVKASQIEEQGQPQWEKKNVTETFKTLQDWKGPGPDQIQAFWLKYFTFSHGQLAEYYSKFLENPESCPNWFTNTLANLYSLLWWIRHTEVETPYRGGVYFGRLKKVSKSELNSANKIQAINTWVVPSIS